MTKFHRHKNPISMYDVNTDRIVVSYKVLLGEKVLNILLGTKIILKNLCLFLFNASKDESIKKKFLMKLNMSFLIKDSELLERYHEVWDKVSNIIKKEFDIEPVYNDKYLKTKIKSYDGKSIKYFIMIKFQKNVLIVFFYQWY